MDKPFSTYIGDGVYASDDRGMIRLRADGEHGQNEIFLEDNVFQALLRFVEDKRKLTITIIERKETKSDG